MPYALKLVDPGWHGDPHRDSTVGFSLARYEQIQKIAPGTEFLLYVNGEGLVGAATVTGSLLQKHAAGSFPLLLPVKLAFEVAAGQAVHVSVLEKKDLRLANQSWLELTKDQHARGFEKLRDASSRRPD